MFRSLTEVAESGEEEEGDGVAKRDYHVHRPLLNTGQSVHTLFAELNDSSPMKDLSP